jgi:hypothetical protein
MRTSAGIDLQIDSTAASQPGEPLKDAKQFAKFGDASLSKLIEVLGELKIPVFDLVRVGIAERFEESLNVQILTTVRRRNLAGDDDSRFLPPDLQTSRFSQSTV